MCALPPGALACLLRGNSAQAAPRKFQEHPGPPEGIAGGLAVGPLHLGSQHSITQEGDPHLAPPLALGPASSRLSRKPSWKKPHSPSPGPPNSSSTGVQPPGLPAPGHLRRLVHSGADPGRGEEASPGWRAAAGSAPQQTQGRGRQTALVPAPGHCKRDRVRTGRVSRGYRATLSAREEHAPSALHVGGRSRCWTPVSTGSSGTQAASGLRRLGASGGIGGHRSRLTEKGWRAET